MYESCFSHVNSIWIGYFIQKKLIKKKAFQQFSSPQDIVINHSVIEVPIQASVLLDEEALKRTAQSTVRGYLDSFWFYRGREPIVSNCSELFSSRCVLGKTTWESLCKTSKVSLIQANRRLHCDSNFRLHNHNNLSYFEHYINTAGKIATCVPKGLQ